MARHNGLADRIAAAQVALLENALSEVSDALIAQQKTSQQLVQQ